MTAEPATEGSSRSPSPAGVDYRSRMPTRTRRTMGHLAFAGPLLLAALSTAPTAGQTPIPGQSGDGQAAPVDRPMARSKYAPDPSTLPELRMIGTLAPSPPPGTMIEGEPVTAWNDDGPTILVFWSPFVGGRTAEHLAQTADVGLQLASVDTISIASGPRPRIETVLDTLPGRTASKPRTVHDDTGAWKRTILDATGQTRLPAVVALDADGRVIFHGPMDTSTMALANVASGKWSADAYRDNVLEYFARQNASTALAEVNGRVRRGTATPADAIALADELIALDPRNGSRQIAKFDILITSAADPEAGYAYGREIAARFPDNYLILNDLAWHTVNLPDVGERDLDFAMEMSRRANDLQGYMDDSTLDTLARVWWMRGDPAEAIRWQRRAVARALDTWHGDATRANLDAYTGGYVQPGQLPPPYRSDRRP